MGELGAESDEASQSWAAGDEGSGGGVDEGGEVGRRLLAAGRAKDDSCEGSRRVLEPLDVRTPRGKWEAIARWTEEEGRGVPVTAVPLREAAAFQTNAALVRRALPRDQLRKWHPAKRFAELDEYVAGRPDRQPMKSPLTAHVPVMWYHTAHLERARQAGANVPIAQGPSPYGGLPAKPFPIEQVYYDRRAWDAQVEWIDAVAMEIKRAQNGYKFRFSRIPGGKDGLRVDESWIRVELRRVQWANVNGRAVPKFPALPDEFTDVDVAGMYKEALRVGVSDMASASEMGYTV
eukprot:SAG11_NODE_1854_length_4165_cov_16.365224_3_plen_291_part_00